MELSEFLTPPEPKETPKHYHTIIVSPGFENEINRSGLHWDTRLRLLAAAIYYEKGYTERIVVGGNRLRNMNDSFANLMKRRLVTNYQIPPDRILTEEYTFDTASQIKWIGQNLDKLDSNTAIITDSEQSKHIKALLNSSNLSQIDILSAEQVVLNLAPKSKHLEKFYKTLYSSPYWLKWKARERFLTLLTKTIDPKGTLIQKLTSKRLKVI